MNTTKWVFRLAVTLAVLGLLLMFVNPVAGLLMATVHAAFAWGVKRRQRWAGPAWLAFLLLPIPFAMRLSGMPLAQVGFSVAFDVGIAVLVLKATIGLWRDETAPQSAWPWVAGILALLSFLVYLHPYVLPSASMEPTLLQGDYFLVRTRFWGAPQRDELIVYRNPADPKDTWVKRIVGVPGDRLRIVDKQLYRNGAAVVEPYAVHLTSYIDAYRDNFPSDPNAPIPARGLEMLAKDVRNGEVVVPAGQYFVMGDNRDDSLDSRYLGFVPAASIIGRPWLIYASYAAQGEDKKRTAFNTRWNRLFKVL